MALMIFWTSGVDIPRQLEVFNLPGGAHVVAAATMTCLRLVSTRFLLDFIGSMAIDTPRPSGGLSLAMVDIPGLCVGMG